MEVDQETVWSVPPEAHSSLMSVYYWERSRERGRTTTDIRVELNRVSLSVIGLDGEGHIRQRDGLLDIVGGLDWAQEADEEVDGTSSENEVALSRGELGKEKEYEHFVSD